jgi:hypothetical protein
VILWRVLPHDPAAPEDGPGGALWFPRPLQGTGRHDNRDRYGCMYVAADPIASIAEALAPFRGSGPLVPALLTRNGRALTLAGIVLDDAAPLVDLDDPAVLLAEGLHPSRVATRARARTQADALRLHDAHPDAAGLRWWSRIEASWINVTLFDRVARQLTLDSVTPLALGDERVVRAAELTGLA